MSAAGQAARRVLAAASHAQEGGGQCVFTGTLSTFTFQPGAAAPVWGRVYEPNINSGVSLLLSDVVFHSEDLEDPDLHPGPARRGRVHGQRLLQDAGASAWAGGVRAVRSPAYPHQGESQLPVEGDLERLNGEFILRCCFTAL